MLKQKPVCWTNFKVLLANESAFINSGKTDEMKTTIQNMLWSQIKTQINNPCNCLSDCVKVNSCIIFEPRAYQSMGIEDFCKNLNQ
jgi:hypothetical protein